MDTLLRRSLHTIKTLKEINQSAKEPIAVIGMACRFPGGCSTPEKFWEFLQNKGDGVRDIPAERWDVEEFYDPNPGVPGKMYLRQANFLQEDVSQFDARFFRISPLEAAEMDPQQRILLELSWEALERAGQNIEQLRESDTGVFIGIIGSDYSRLPRDPGKVNPYRGTGSIPSIASGRIAHVLGFHGPALSVDTTCSSSLVSLQLACDSLRKQKCDMALAGGVNMMLSPNPMISLCMMNALSADGRCRPFDGDGQGYGRAEGAGLVVLKRLSTALEDNDPILAVIRSTAVNQDGPSSGLTVPNGNAQRELICEALLDAGLTGSDINYLEAHGTGTSLGDPIEIKAVKEALGENRTADNPLVIGSVKGNVGHLEGAAGICGLIKVVLCLQHQQIPANVNLDTPNPRVPLKQIPAYVPSDLTDWTPADGRKRVAGLSSFGFSGTNAHVILTEAPETDKNTAALQLPQRLSVMTLSAKTEWAFRQLLHDYRQYLQTNPTVSLSDLCYTANAGRADFAHRAAFIAADVRQIAGQLEALLAGKPLPETVTGQTNEEDNAARIAFLFTDHIHDLSRELYDVSPLFRRFLQQCDDLFRPRLGISIIDVLYAGSPDHYPVQAQDAALFSAQYAAGRFLLSLNVKPAAVWGQSAAANYAAVCVAGILSLEDAASLLLDVNHAIGDGCQPPHCRFMAPATGLAAKKSELLNPSYWRQIPADSPDINALIDNLREQGYQQLLVIGGNRPATAHPGHLLRTINGSWEPFINTLAGLYCSGAAINWRSLYADESKPRKILLPTYPFERKRYWSPLKPTASLISEHSVAPKSREPLQGRAVMSPVHTGQHEYAYELSPDNLPEAKDTHGIIHVGYYQEIIRRAVTQAFNRTDYTVTEKSFLSALILPPEDTAQVRLILEPDKDDAQQQCLFKFYSQTGSMDQWELHVTGRISLGNATQERHSLAPATLTAIKERCRKHCSGEAFYRQLQQRDINLGPAVQWVDEIWYSPGEVLARFKQPSTAAQFGAYALKFHPGVIDACAQVFHSALWDDTPEDMKFMVIKWRDFTYLSEPQDQTLWCHVLLEEEGVPRGSIRGGFDLFDGQGNRVASVAQNEMKGLKGFNVRELKKLKEEAKTQSKGMNPALKEKLAAAATVQQRAAVLTGQLQQVATEVLSIPVEDIDPADSLMEMGIDSMTGVMFQAAVQRDIGVELPLETIIQGPSLAELTRQLLAEMPGEEPSGDNAAASPALSYSAADHDRWFVHSKYRDTAGMRLFCLPYGGGGASIYAQWQDYLPADVDVCAIQLPHRENRLKEPAITDIEVMLDQLLACIESRLDLPFAFYGHSMGALLAYRLAYRLWQQGQSADNLFVGGFSSPRNYPNPLFDRTTARLQALGIKAIPDIEQVKAMSEEQLKQFTGAFSGFRRIPDEEKELRQLLLPIFVGDLQLVASYRPQPEELFDIPISAFHGEKDAEVSQPEMAGWRDLTSGEFNLHTLPGDHLFLQKDQSQAAVMQLINRHLVASMQGVLPA